VSEIKLTDQRPRTTTGEMPEHLKSDKPKLPPDPELVKLIAEWKRKGEEKFGRATGGGR